MEFKKYGDTYYIRSDKGDDIIENILQVCREERITSCTYSGIGGCSRAEIQTFIPETGQFETHVLEGMLELLSLNGSVIADENGQLFHHTHAVFSYKDGEEHRMSGGHMKSIMVRYTGEIVLQPVQGPGIRRAFDPETGTGFWKFM